MLIKSVYMKNSVIAVATFKKDDNSKLTPCNLQQFGAEAFSFVDEVKRDLSIETRVVVKPDDFKQTEGEPTSFLRDLLKKEQVDHITVLKTFEPAQGLATLGKMKRYGTIDLSNFAGWAKMEAEVERVEQSQSAGLLAFLQGLVYYEKQPNTDWLANV